VEVVCPEPGWLPDVLREAGIQVHVSPMKNTGWCRTMALLLRRRSKIDLIHTHLTRAAYIGYSAGMIARVPTVTSVHIANNDPIYKRLARRGNRLVAVSNFVRGMLHGLGVPLRQIDTVYNGTDFIDFAPTDPSAVKEELRIPAERRLVGLVGRVCKEKGHLELIEAMGEIRRDHPDAHVLFVGQVQEEFAPVLEDAIVGAGLQGRVTLTGVRHDVPRMLDSMTLSAMPSHLETFGVAAIEAMARGKAVVASRVGGLPEIVRHKQTGLLIDLRPGELAQAVDYMLREHDEREQMGRMGRDLVRQKFTLEEMVGRFEGVYGRALGRE
jgi:glycosyltransferase involved in cell wall biosynthesis